MDRGRASAVIRAAARTGRPAARLGRTRGLRFATEDVRCAPGRDAARLVQHAAARARRSDRAYSAAPALARLAWLRARYRARRGRGTNDADARDAVLRQREPRMDRRAARA